MLSLPHSAGDSRNHIKSPDPPQFQRNLSGKKSTSVLTAEVKFAQFVPEHSLPFSVADHFTKLAKQLFPDSDIAGKFTSGRVKTTMIVKKALAPRLDANVVQLCENHKFSLLTDESNDQGGEKTLAILVKVFNPEIARAVTRFVDIGTGANLFETIDNCFRYLLIFFNCKFSEYDHFITF